ncbi:uncharacterized protein [Diadema antillarum]|uniref:uncharacterized protein n=1 Tax=Diadema antillarum TaxID=105358 RepID=UPI003A86FF18
MQETLDSSFPVSGEQNMETEYSVLTIGSPVCFAAIVLAILSLAWCKHHQKKNCRHPENSNKSSTHSSHSINTNAMHRALPEHPGNKTGDATANQDEVHHIYQNSAEDHTLEGEVVNNLPDTISRPLRDVRPTRFEQEKTCYINKVTSFGQEINRDMSIQFRPADNAIRCEVSEWSVYEDILSTSNQSASIREPQHGHEYATIERNEKRDPLAIGLNNSLYSVTIYSSKQREERELDENGYLVLEACSGKIAEDQYVEMDKEVLTTASLYEDMLFPQNKSPLAK